MTDDTDARHEAAAYAILDFMASRVREDELCPSCLTQLIQDRIIWLIIRGLLKHDNRYSEDERRASPFFNEKISFRDLSALDSAGGAKH